MSIDIDRLTEAELVDLNHRIVERLRFLDQMRAHKAMLDFAIGESVMFEDRNGQTVQGTLTRYNRKSVTVIASDGRQWNVAPGLLRKGTASTPNLITIHHK